MVQPLTFELRYRRQAYTRVGANWVRDEAKDATIPAIPPGFAPLKGDHPTVAARADALNRTQERSSFRHYFFFPELA